MSRLARAAGAERMDEPGQDAGELARALGDLRRVNRWLGGTRVVLHHLSILFGRHPRPRYRVLDVATGSGDVPLAIARWARRRAIDVVIVGLDNHHITLALAREHLAGEASVTTELADALRLPYGDGDFDFALCSTALHHFDRQDDAIQVLRELDRVSSLGWIVSDLARSRPALLGARLLAATVWRRHPITRHDGPLSVRRALTASELRALADEAGFAAAVVHSHFPFRIALVADKA